MSPENDIQDEPTLTVVTVVKNAVETIAQCLESVKTSNEVQHIIIDGKSHDGTLDVLNEHKASNRIVLSEPDQGLYFAMNKAIPLITGRFVVYLNADDYFEKNSLELVIKTMKTHVENVDSLIIGDLKYVDSKLSLHVEIDELPNRMIPHPSTFIHRDLLRKLKGFNTKYKVAADYDLILRAYKMKANFVQLGFATTWHRSGGFSSHHSRISIYETFLIQTKNFPNRFFCNLTLAIKSLVRNMVASRKQL